MNLLGHLGIPLLFLIFSQNLADEIGDDQILSLVLILEKKIMKHQN